MLQEFAIEPTVLDCWSRYDYFMADCGVEKGRLVEGTGRVESRTGGRPAERFQFRREVLRERQAPGVRLPGLPN